MTEVHLIYTGIVGFVRTDDGLTVVIQDARDAGHNDESHAKHESPHTPHVVIESGAYVSNKNLSELHPDHGESDNGLRAFLLEHYTIQVTNSPREAMLSENTNFMLVLERGCPPNAPGCGGILRHVLGGKVPDGGGATKKVSVAARMPLPRGRLEATYVAPDQQWRFEGLAGLPMRLAEEVCHTFNIDDGEDLEISFEKNAGEDGVLVVKVPKDANPKTIEVRIGNLPKNLVFLRKYATAPQDDEHVKLYYDLSALPPPSRRKLVYIPATALSNPPQDAHTHRLTPAAHRVTPETSHLTSGAHPMMVRGPNCPPALWA